MHKTRKRSPIIGLIKISLPVPDSYSTETEPKMLPFFPNTNYQVHSCPRVTRKSQIFNTNHMLGTLDFTGSEHWAPFNFP